MEKKNRTLYLSLETIAIFLVFLSLGRMIVWGGEYFGGMDLFYHFRVAEKIAYGEWIPTIDWLPFSILGESGADHHWLFHVLLVPFTFFTSDYEGLRWAIVFFLAIVPAGLNIVFRLFRIPYAPVFVVIGMFCDPFLISRFTLLRAQSISIILMLLAIYWMMRGKHLRLFIVSYIFMLSYHGAILLIPLSLLWVGVCYFFEKRLDVKPVGAIAVGIASGLIINPWYPATVEYLLFHLHFKLLNPLGLYVGGEWAPYGLTNIFHYYSIAILLSIVIVPLCLYRIHISQREAWHKEIVFLGFVVLFFWVLTIKNLRMVEYLGPLFALFLGILVLHSSFSDSIKLNWKSGGIFILAWVWIMRSAYQAEELYISSIVKEPSAFARAGDYIKQHAPKGSIIFNNHWSFFAPMVWHAPDYRYVTGLDPNYLAYKNIDKMIAYQNIVYGGLKEGDGYGKAIYENFNSRWFWIVIGARFQDRDIKLAQRLNMDSDTQLAFNDGIVIIFHYVGDGK